MAFDDNNDNTSKLMEFLASEDAGTEWVSTGAIVSPNKAVPLDAYLNELVKKEARRSRTPRSSPSMAPTSSPARSAPSGRPSSRGS